MTSQLVCRPEQDLPVALLRVSGVLDTVTGDALRHAVARSLSAQPEALLIDVSALEVSDPLGLGALNEVVCQTAQWPAVPIVLCGAGPETSAALTSSPDCLVVHTADELRAGPARHRRGARAAPDPGPAAAGAGRLPRRFANWSTRPAGSGSAASWRPPPR